MAGKHVKLALTVTAVVEEEREEEERCHSGVARDQGKRHNRLRASLEAPIYCNA